jgi:hypothetical protein
VSRFLCDAQVRFAYGLEIHGVIGALVLVQSAFSHFRVRFHPDLRVLFVKFHHGIYT